MNLVEYITQHNGVIVEATIRHLELFAAAMVFSIILGLVIAVLVNARPHGAVAQWVLNVTAAFQAIPSIAVVAVTFLFLGIGVLPAIVALIVYSLAPIVFNTVSGLASVSGRNVSAAQGMGYSPRQVLFLIQFPIALPVIMGGIRSAATINIGTATVAALIGGGGLGDLIFSGLKLRNNEAILTGALLAALLAVLIDLVFSRLERALTSPGIRVK